MAADAGHGRWLEGQRVLVTGAAGGLGRALVVEADLRGIIDDIKHSGITTVRGIRDELQFRGIGAPRGDTWHPTAVARLLNRLNNTTHMN